MVTDSTPETHNGLPCPCCGHEMLAGRRRRLPDDALRRPRECSNPDCKYKGYSTERLTEASRVSAAEWRQQ